MAPWPHPSAKESTLPSPNPVSNNAGSSSSPPSDDFTHDDKETLQSDSFHSEEKPALLKSYTEFEIEKLKSSASVVRNKNPNQGSPPRSLMTPSISGHPCGNGESFAPVVDSLWLILLEVGALYGQECTACW